MLKFAQNSASKIVKYVMGYTITNSSSTSSQQDANNISSSNSDDVILSPTSSFIMVDEFNDELKQQQQQQSQQIQISSNTTFDNFTDVFLEEMGIPKNLSESIKSIGNFIVEEIGVDKLNEKVRNQIQLTIGASSTSSSSIHFNELEDEDEVEENEERIDYIPTPYDETRSMSQGSKPEFVSIGLKYSSKIMREVLSKQEQKQQVTPDIFIKALRATCKKLWDTLWGLAQQIYSSLCKEDKTLKYIFSHSCTTNNKTEKPDVKTVLFASILDAVFFSIFSTCKTINDLVYLLRSRSAAAK